MIYVTWREKVAALKLGLLEEMRAKLTAREAEVFALCTRKGITDKNRDDVLDLLDRTLRARSVGSASGDVT